ncbi:MAG: nucleoid-structuring protein H-NS, partial [Eubacteriales bacterium]|nr:nucleoid-structuring protein H-NS [Eubacteriales bacterium]
MEQKGELVSFRPDIKVVDCTIRDGGLVNNFYFEDQFVKNLYTANVAAGVDYMEFGY